MNFGPGLLSALILSLSFTTQAEAKSKKTVPKPVRCAVVTLVDDNFFDEGLQDLNSGDEDYAFISLDRAAKKKTIRIGGFQFPRTKSDRVTVTEEAKGFIVTITTKDYGILRFSHNNVDGKSRLVVVESGQERTLAVTNCLYDQGIDPYAKNDLTY